jgi:hypothetical protein
MENPPVETQGKATNAMMNQQQNLEDKQKLLRITTGLPKRGTRWARAKNPPTERA